MKYLIFSDTHLLNSFDKRKFDVLKDAIQGADQVIINGDFWEGFRISFDEFVTSPWSTTLFPLLKKKHTIYLFGNHDKKQYINKSVSLFSDEQKSNYIFKSGDKVFHVEHGNRFIKLPDLKGWQNAVLEIIEDALYKLLGKTFLKLAYGHFNSSIKRKIKETLKKNEYLITGHTHLAEVDQANRYINEGFTKHGLAQYVYIEDGIVTAVEKKY